MNQANTVNKGKFAKWLAGYVFIYIFWSCDRVLTCSWVDLCVVVVPFIMVALLFLENKIINVMAIMVYAIFFLLSLSSCCLYYYYLNSDDKKIECFSIDKSCRGQSWKSDKCYFHFKGINVSCRAFIDDEETLRNDYFVQMEYREICDDVYLVYGKNTIKKTKAQMPVE